MFGKPPPANRAQCLEKVNGILAAYGLPAWTEDRLGDRAKGQPEIIDVVETRDESPDSVVFDLMVADPSGAIRTEHVRVGGRSIVIVPVLATTDGARHVWMIRRWRVGRGSWSYELPLVSIPMDAHDPARSAFAAAFGTDASDAVGHATPVRLGAVIAPCRADDAEAWLLRGTVARGTVARTSSGEAVRVAESALSPFVSGRMRLPDPVTQAVLCAAALALALS